MASTTATSRNPPGPTQGYDKPPRRDHDRGRSIGPRRSLPSSRAVVGALLITVAAVGAFAIAQRGQAQPSTRYVVITAAVAPGARIDASAVATRAMDLDAGVAAHAFRDARQVVGAVALAPMSPGQLVQAPDIALADKVEGQVLVGHELTFPVERDRVPQNLHRGERVAVLATYGTGSDARTATTAQQAIVLSFDTDSDNIGTQRTARLTLLLSDPSTVIETVHASQAADITIVRTTQADTALPDTFRTSVSSTVPGKL